MSTYNSPVAKLLQATMAKVAERNPNAPIFVEDSGGKSPVIVNCNSFADGTEVSIKLPKSKRGAVRQYNILLNAYKRAFDGGGMFGFDWPTMRANDPDTYAKIQALKTIYKGLPD